jgi:Ca2+-binding EF-hand superfamily protein
MRQHALIMTVVMTLGLTGCGLFGDRPPPRHEDTEFHPPRSILEAYDANHDGIIARSEMEAGLRVDFAKADVNHDGKLDADEARAVNAERLEADQSTASPLVDWNHDGFIDFSEFAATARSLFDQMDLDGDGKLTQKELHPPRGTPRPPS